jgi:hypothetical protein
MWEPRGIKILRAFTACYREDFTLIGLRVEGRKEIHIRFSRKYPERNRSLGKHRHSWEDIIKIDLKEMGWGNTDWIYLVQGRD